MKSIYNVIPQRIAYIREKKGLTQLKLAEELTEFEGGTSFSQNMIAMWESGRRTVQENKVKILSAYFSVSIAYLYGLTDNPDEEFSDEILSGVVKLKNPDEELSKLEIAFENLYKYDGQPVFVEFLDFSYKSAWGLYDRKQEKIFFIDMEIFVSYLKRSHNVKIYIMRPNFFSSYAEEIKKPLDMARLLNLSRVYVKMKTTDREICAQYNGWYRHNENHTALINSNGLVLPYTGLAVSYNAYSEGSIN